MGKLPPRIAQVFHCTDPQFSQPLIEATADTPFFQIGETKYGRPIILRAYERTMSFEDAVKRVEKIGDMLHRNVTAEDVTEEFRDLEVRLRGARAVQERLTQLLAKATKVEESVLIEKELDRVSGEIDRVDPNAREVVAALRQRGLAPRR